MTESLPLTVTSEDLFEKGDRTSSYLLTKLEAWLNFQALCANWYADEDFVVQCHFTFLPEQSFYNKELRSDIAWHNIQQPMLVYSHDKTNKTFNVFVMLSNDEINTAMNNPKQVEAMLQHKLSDSANQLVSEYQLAPIK